MKKVVALMLFSLVAPLASAELAIIVHPSNQSELDKKVISRIYLGKSKSFPNGDQVVPLNQADDSEATKTFNSNLLKKSSSQLKAYWSKLVFTGKGTPPKNLSDNDEVIKLVANNPNMIGYIDVNAVNDSVKVVATF